MARTRLPRIVGFDIPPLKPAVDVVRDAPLVGLLDGVPSQSWIDAFLAAADRANGPLDGALVSVEADRVLFFSPASEARTRCDHVRRLVDDVSTRLASVPQEVTEAQPRVEKSQLVGEGRRILVVEDDADLREIACDVLADAGYCPLPAGSFSAAVAVLEGGPVHALVADIDLAAREDGATLVRLVDQRWPTIGLVVVTGRYADGTLALPGRAVFLAKPYQRRQLLAVVDSASRHRV